MKWNIVKGLKFELKKEEGKSDSNCNIVNL